MQIYKLYNFNIKIMSRIPFRLLFLSINLICLMCTNMSFAQDTLSIWQKQLEYMKNKTYKENNGDLNHLILKEYMYKGTIGSEVEKSRIIDSILSYDAPSILFLPPEIIRDTIMMGDSCVIKEKRFPRFDIISIGKMMEIVDTMNIEYPFIMMKESLCMLIEIGFNYLELEWNYKEKTFKTICIVSNESGNIIYELIGSNITIQESTKIMFEK